MRLAWMMQWSSFGAQRAEMISVLNAQITRLFLVSISLGLGLDKRAAHHYEVFQPCDPRSISGPKALLRLTHVNLSIFATEHMNSSSPGSQNFPPGLHSSIHPVDFHIHIVFSFPHSLI